MYNLLKVLNLKYVQLESSVPFSSSSQQTFWIQHMNCSITNTYIWFRFRWLTVVRTLEDVYVQWSSSSRNFESCSKWKCILKMHFKIIFMELKGESLTFLKTSGFLSAFNGIVISRNKIIICLVLVDNIYSNLIINNVFKQYAKFTTIKAHYFIYFIS